MLIDFKDLKTEDYDIPPFQVNQGKIVLVHLYGGSHYYPLKSILVDALTRTQSDEQVTVHQPFTFVAPFKEPALSRLFHPVTVEEYINRNTGPDKTVANNIYSDKQITQKTRVKDLSASQQKLLNVYTTVSKTKYIVFDLDGLCPQSSEDVYAVIKGLVKNGISAIYIDWSDDFKNDCSNYIELQSRFKSECSK